MLVIQLVKGLVAAGTTWDVLGPQHLVRGVYAWDSVHGAAGGATDRTVDAGPRGQLAADEGAVKRGPSGPASGSPEGATLTATSPTRSCERVRMGYPLTSVKTGANPAGDSARSGSHGCIRSEGQRRALARSGLRRRSGSAASAFPCPTYRRTLTTMSTFSIRDLSRNASRVVDEVTRTGRPALVTKRGELVAAVVPLSPEEVEDYVLAHSPDLIASLAEAERDYAAGRSVSLADALAELGD